VKAYILTEADFERLRAAIKQDPRFQRGAVTQNNAEQMAHLEAHRFINFQVCNWIDSVQK
jgi:hypothetical protein